MVYNTGLLWTYLGFIMVYPIVYPISTWTYPLMITSSYSIVSGGDPTNQRTKRCAWPRRPGGAICWAASEPLNIPNCSLGGHIYNIYVYMYIYMIIYVILLLVYHMYTQLFFPSDWDLATTE